MIDKMNNGDIKNKKDARKIIFNKYGGKCAFCGCHLGKGWHTWDIEPIKTIVNANGDFSKINTEDENLMPACKKCGSLRIRSSSHKMTIKEFRNEIIQSFEFLQKGSITGNSYDRAVRFGFIVETGKEKDLKFYFETMK